MADRLNLNLICHGAGGQPWWNARQFLVKQEPSVISNAEFIVLVHTNADRIPTSNLDIGLTDHSDAGSSEISRAINLYFKYIHDHNFLSWSQRQWFREIEYMWGHKKICHLHSFPWTSEPSEIFSGLNIITNLCSISLNEIGATEFVLYNDTRLNHLNKHNNTELANQLAEMLKDFQSGKLKLDISKFDLKTLKWFKWQ